MSENSRRQSLLENGFPEKSLDAAEILLDRLAEMCPEMDREIILDFILETPDYFVSKATSEGEKSEKMYEEPFGAVQKEIEALALILLEEENGEVPKYRVQKMHCRVCDIRWSDSPNCANCGRRGVMI